MVGRFGCPSIAAFIQRGFGTVVTGTASGAPVRDGTPVWIQPLGLSSRIRGLQVHGDAVEQATSGHRVAANLAGIERDDLARGMVVVADPDLTPASVLDVHLSMLSQAPRIASGQHVRLLIGTAEVLAVADPIGQARRSSRGAPSGPAADREPDRGAPRRPFHHPSRVAPADTRRRHSTRPVVASREAEAPRHLCP